ncbi:metallophosphoesterase [Pedobacter agri]|uniref:metallophosphoesterase n=1 Tax=Pedobacter agri TaxID=454586 RepID=UPI00292D05DC|nr:metallophosphoesterase [Pedobacter agri]
MDALNILHLSDLHIGNFNYTDARIPAINIADTLMDQARMVEIILVSGDIFDGRSKNYKADRDFAILFFNTLLDQLNNKELSNGALTKNDILFVPGNHDLVRSEDHPYRKYDDFISEFLKDDHASNVTYLDKYNFICDFHKKKIAILGFNSCRIELDKAFDLTWIDKINFSKYGDEAEGIKDLIRDNRRSVVKWDDFGYIDPLELDNVFTSLKRIIPGFSEYNIISTFHHHFYPFPELAVSDPDSSFIRNYTYVLDRFQKHNVKLVLHGHKHMPVQRVITDNKYFDNPESIIYVFAAGSIGSKDVDNRSFQWIKVYDKSYVRLAECERYTFKGEELESAKTFIIPPEMKDEKSFSENLLEMLHLQESKYYQKYIALTNEFEQLISDSKIQEVIGLVGNLFTIFGHIKLELRRIPKINYVLLLILNYRVIYLRNLHLQSEITSALLGRLRTEIESVLGNDVFADAMMAFLNAISNDEIERAYFSIIKNVSSENKRIGAYCSIGLFISDLFLCISNYGEFYFEKEKLNHKINISLQANSFYNSIPSNSISLKGDTDRRAVVMSFKSKDPTVHKVAVLIIKDFEMRLDKFEESLKEIKLKLYYIIPKIEAENYDLENFHFDAYIPTLLPLLTGDNLYRSKEVFIRELVQNSIDASLLRKQIQPDESFDRDIHIVLGEEKRIDGKMNKFFKIIDSGVGMSRFTIERYFTSIGRSYYVSEEFDELKRDNNIKYNAISNFGIGFLSSFMVCKEVLVETKNVFLDEEFNGLEIEIPNYDGCFFIRKKEKADVGTHIKLYEDERKLFNFERFVNYMKRTLVGLPVNIKIDGNAITKHLKIKAYGFQNKMLSDLQKTNRPLFYVPFSEESKTGKYLSWDKLYNASLSSLDKFGIWFDFGDIFQGRNVTKREHIVTLNQGLLVSYPHIPFNFTNQNLSLGLKINYPSSFIQLDVAREKILNLKANVDVNNVIPLLSNQIEEFMRDDSGKILGTSLADLFFMEYILKVDFKQDIGKSISKEVYTLKIEFFDNTLKFSLCKISEVPELYNDSNICYLHEQHGTRLNVIEKFFINFAKEFMDAKLKKSKNDKVYTNLNKSKHKLIFRNNELITDWYESSAVSIHDTLLTHISRSGNQKNFEYEGMLLFKRESKVTELSYMEIISGLIPLSKNMGDKNGKEILFLLINTLTLLKCSIFNNIVVRDSSSFNLEIKLEDIGLIKQHNLFDSQEK